MLSGTLASNTGQAAARCEEIEVFRPSITVEEVPQDDPGEPAVIHHGMKMRTRQATPIEAD